MYNVPPIHSPPENIKINYDPRMMEIGAGNCMNQRQKMPGSNLPPNNCPYGHMDHEEAIRFRMYQERLDNPIPPLIQRVNGVFREDLKMGPGPYGEKLGIGHPPIYQEPIQKEGFVNGKPGFPMPQHLINGQYPMKQILRQNPPAMPPRHDQELFRMHRVNQEPHEMRVNENYQREMQNENN